MSEEFKPRILFFDIENAPHEGYTWATYDTNVVAMKQESYMLSFSYKFAGDKKVTTVALRDFPLFQTDPKNDIELIKALREVLDQADVVVGHNSDKFDIKKFNGRCAINHLPPPSPYAKIDTLKILRRYFSLPSYKLGDVCVLLGLGEKLDTGGIQLWLDCMAGFSKAWDKMCRYNARDVVLTEKLYEFLKPWHTTHPRLSPYPNCAQCGSKVQRRGPAVSRTKGQQYRFQCTNKACAAWETRMDTAA